MCWVAIDRALALHARIGLPVDAAALDRERDALRADIDAHGYDAALGSYVGAYGAREADASLLLMPRLGYLAADDPRMLGTLRHVERELGVGPLLYRYPPGPAYDGVEGRDNPFLMCSFWRVECLARLGRLDEAHTLLEQLLALRSPAGLLAEEADAERFTPLGNYPQAFSHAGLIAAALALEAAGESP